MSREEAGPTDARRGGREAGVDPRADATSYCTTLEVADLDAYAAEAPPGFEMSLTGAEAGPWRTTVVRLDRGSLMFGTEGGANAGHARIPPGVVVFHVTMHGAPPLVYGIPLTSTRIAVGGRDADKIESVPGASRGATFATEPAVVEAAERRLRVRGPTCPPATYRVVAVSRATAVRIRRLLAQFDARMARSPGDFAAPDVRADVLQRLAEEFVRAVASGRPVPSPAGAAAPAHERILLESMRHLGRTKDDLVTIKDLCEVAGTSQRTLTRVFREALAVSPARYLRLRRMSQVRAWLRRGSPRPPSVTEAATRFGFFELGRFAGEYRRMFGELPSETLRRRGES